MSVRILIRQLQSVVEDPRVGYTLGAHQTQLIDSYRLYLNSIQYLNSITNTDHSVIFNGMPVLKLFFKIHNAWGDLEMVA